MYDPERHKNSRATVKWFPQNKTVLLLIQKKQSGSYHHRVLQPITHPKMSYK